MKVGLKYIQFNVSILKIDRYTAFAVSVNSASGGCFSGYAFLYTAQFGDTSREQQKEFIPGH